MRLTAGDHDVEINNADKPLFPQEDVTKAELADYYAKTAGALLEHAAGRPVSMKRYPDGIDAPGWVQKSAPDYFPDWIERCDVPVEGGRRTVRHMVLRRPEDLVYLADQACITPHVWLSTTEALDHPDRMIFDMDPSDDALEPLRAAARTVRRVLDGRGLRSYVMTSGSRGYHVWVPLDARADFDTVRAVARSVADEVVAADPAAFTVAHRKADRGRRVFIDYLRNAYGQTSVPPYAARGKPGAPVATPLDWDELATAPRDFTVRNVLRRMARKRDPWRDLRQHPQSLPTARR